MEGTKNQKELLESLRKLWEKHPEQRLGQLLENFVFYEDSMYHQEDDETLEKIKKA